MVDDRPHFCYSPPMNPIESLQIAIEDHNQSLAGAIVTPRQHTWTLERCGGWTKVRLSHYGTTPRRYVGTGDENDDIAIYYRQTGYGDYQVSDLFSTERLCMLLEPWDIERPAMLRQIQVFENRCDVKRLAQTVVVLIEQAITWINRETGK